MKHTPTVQTQYAKAVKLLVGMIADLHAPAHDVGYGDMVMARRYYTKAIAWRSKVEALHSDARLALIEFGGNVKGPAIGMITRSYNRFLNRKLELAA